MNSTFAVLSGTLAGTGEFRKARFFRNRHSVLPLGLQATFKDLGYRNE